MKYKPFTEVLMSKKNTAATIATIIVAVLAIATTLLLLYLTSQQQIQETSYTFVPSAEVEEEMNINASALIKNNCEVFRIYLQYGLPHQEEPYGNLPEDGYYTVISDNYKTMADIEKLVNETFIEKEAKRILTNINGDDIAVYAEETDDDGNKGIGLDMNMVDENGRFKAIEYDYSWANAKLTPYPKSNTECDIVIELNPLNSASADGSSSADGETKQITANMVKANGQWRLQKLTY